MASKMNISVQSYSKKRKWQGCI
ncbi:hypothetical protein [Staphylococcus intermedius]|nr:hypothetical protein [Staphylococcus intermedius]